MAVISCRQVAVKLGGRQILRSISFDVVEGGFVCVMGANGSGKSTLLRAMLGLVPIAEGSVFLGDGLKRGDIGYLSQQVNLRQDFPATVWEVVLSGCLNRRGWRPYFRPEEKELAEFGLTYLGIVDARKALFRDLSGGQKQRVLLARAFCAAGRLLVLDEPAKNLDEEGVRLLASFLDEVNRIRNVAVIVVSHDREAALQAKRVFVLDEGACVFWGKSEHLDTMEHLDTSEH
ncbi:MAG: metal ABC transporter ATP-binding protein [Peptococcaceae bacterium]|nr:metal ABC transporter ATP-binding protein [Peptococcaceae bacterium]